MGCRCVSCHDFGALGEGWEKFKMVQRLEGGLGRVRRQFSGGREEPKRSPRGGQEEPKRCQEEPKGGQEEPKRRLRGAQEEPKRSQEEPRIAKVKGFLSAEADNTGPRARPTKTFVKNESRSV